MSSHARDVVNVSPSDPGRPLLSFENIAQSFVSPTGEGELDVLRDMSFSVRTNQFTAIVGPSGCGKSTLLRLAAGLDRPSDGTVRFEDKDITGVDPEVGFITQQANLFPWFTLAQNVGFPLVLQRRPKAELAEKVAHYLELAGLTGFEDHYPHQLSGGMQKRAAIVRTLIYAPRVVLMDEPFGSLDAQSKMLMHSDLLRLWQEQRQTVLFVTHDLHEAVTLADNVILLSRQPTHIKATVDVTLPRPRNVFEPYSMPGYVETYDEVWDLFRSEVIEDDRSSS
jgi:NitT/TauT family transport system ATP-binding protein